VVLALTAIVAVVAWQYGIVYERDSVRDLFTRSEPWSTYDNVPGAGKPMRISPLRMAFGDEAIYMIEVQCKSTVAELENVRRLFPKARVQRARYW
jgi:hypothetical protein